MGSGEMRVDIEESPMTWEIEDRDLDEDGVDVLFDYEGGWLVYEYTGFLKKVYPSRRAWIGHRCAHGLTAVNGVGFVNAQQQGKEGCGWCDTAIPDEIHGVMALYNYGKEGERHGDDNQG
jgi:hypothetical protein